MFHRAKAHQAHSHSFLARWPWMSSSLAKPFFRMVGAKNDKHCLYIHTYRAIGVAAHPVPDLDYSQVQGAFFTALRAIITRHADSRRPLFLCSGVSIGSTC